MTNREKIMEELLTKKEALFEIIVGGDYYIWQAEQAGLTVKEWLEQEVQL